jgi:hypothetical protein
MVTVEKATGSSAGDVEEDLEPAGSGNPASATAAMSAAIATTDLRRITEPRVAHAAGPRR